MMMKYRVHEVAKDLGVPSKDVIDFLSKYYNEPHKHMTALSEEELNLVFEHYTQKGEVANFDTYFNMKKPETAKAQPTAEQKTPVAENSAAASGGTAEKTPPANTRPQQGNRPQSGTQPNRPQNNRPGQQFQQAHGGQQNRPSRAPTGGQHPAPQAQQTPTAAPAGPRPSAADRTVRHVDTRGAQVELDKYNMRYEEITPDRAKKDNIQRKQKLHQRSANRRPNYAKRETEAEKLKRLVFEKSKKTQLKVSIPDEIAVGELAARLKVTAADLIKKLMALGVMAAISDTVDYDTAALAAIEFGAKVEHEVVVTIEEQLIDDSEDKEEDLEVRSPVVVVMGHVDHGKTSLLDAIRHSDVATGEAGGITQHIGAYRVKLQGRYLTFLDTPGHAAFTSMRARGAQATDIAILVVAADDGIMPQTIEAINHAKAAEVSIIVAINKIDKPGADPQRVMQGLTEYGLVPEEWGGDTICVPVSAKKHENIDKLLEMVLLVADMKNLRANPKRAGTGVVIEAKLDKGRGPVATLLVQNGTLHTGDVLIAGTTVGHVRAMTDEKGNKLEDAGPSVPVEITGLSEVPAAGDVFHCVQDERMARELVEQRRTQEKEEQFGAIQKVTLDNLFDQMQLGEIKEFNVIVKADVQGSAEALKQSLLKLSNDEVKLKVIHSGVGAINESDVQLAEAFNALVIGFNVRPETAARDNAAMAGVELRMYRVIYDCIAEVEAAMKGMLAPKVREVQLGRAEVRLVYKISNVGTIAGCYVLEGKVTRGSQIRVVRDGIVITEDEISSLKRFKDDAKEVQQGFECGIGLEKYNDIKEGDIFESFIMEEYRD
ncbi:MAG: translation initiation factor IF-2 [Ethanoligenens sp.]